jgi:hypothetical protein
MLPIETDDFGEVVKTGTNELTSVPYGTFRVIVCPLITPDTDGLAKEKVKNSFSALKLFDKVVTLTVYVLVVTPSSAVTTYRTDCVKLFVFTPLIWTVWPTFTDALADNVKVATKLCNEVPNGTETEMFVPLITPEAEGVTIPKEVISQALLLGAEVVETVTAYDLVVVPSSAVTI